MNRRPFSPLCRQDPPRYNYRVSTGIRTAVRRTMMFHSLPRQVKRSYKKETNDVFSTSVKTGDIDHSAGERHLSTRTHPSHLPGSLQLAEGIPDLQVSIGVHQRFRFDESFEEIIGSISVDNTDIFHFFQILLLHVPSNEWMAPTENHF